MNSIEFFAPPALTLSASLFALNSDAVAEGASSVIEQGGTKGHYVAEFGGALNGAHLLVAYEAGVAVAAHYVYLTPSVTALRSGNYADVVCAEQAELLRRFEQNKLVTNPVSGSLTIYAEDDATPLLVADLFEDVAQTQRYRGQGVEVRGRLA